MDFKGFQRNSGLVAGLFLVVIILASGASAWGGGRHGGHFGHFGFYSGFNHGYGGWGYYWPSWRVGYDYGYVSPSVGAVVAVLPEQYTVVVANGIRYYYCDGYYFRSCPSGYVIVPAPVTYVTSAAPAATPQAAATTSQATVEPSVQDASKPATPAVAAPTAKAGSDETVTVNIPAANGGFAPVKLTKFKDGFIGPQGEFYKGHPTVEELRVLYGK